MSFPPFSVTTFLPLRARLMRRRLIWSRSEPAVRHPGDIDDVDARVKLGGQLPWRQPVRDDQSAARSALMKPATVIRSASPGLFRPG
ncbi:hypothetical protein D0Z08_15145 [Nocardioides immobilis]|uniref:Uncharacterized protein n=1 Tax=Nocardioides immobilis TaxID=2049295 RepID=A0A417Y119_9ACTN|nr:hypothetical protein D0Z08_15145 [Nocardioides immobilis]